MKNAPATSILSLANALLFTVLFVPFLCWSQAAGEINSRLLQHAEACPRTNNEVATIHDYLVGAAANKRERAELFFYWMAKNIAYDVRRFQSGDLRETGRDILKTRKAICEEYARLYKAFCDRSGIACYVVSGYAKGYGYDGGFPNGTNHAWNVVKIDDAYLFVDVTWGSGSVTNKSGRLIFIPEIKPQEVLVESDDFRARHLAGNPQWQLLEQPITYKDFVSHDNFAEMQGTAVASFNFRDTIAQFSQLTIEQQRIREWEQICAFRPTVNNYHRASIVFAQVAWGWSTPEIYVEADVRRAKQTYQQGIRYLRSALAAAKRQKAQMRAELDNMEKGVKYCEYRLANKR
ncbi:MAG: transglutaminase domain-containing protein [Bacteroidota bacterium]